MFAFHKAVGQTYPADFAQVPVATGINQPTVMAFSPDGRIFVARQNGVLRVIKDGTLLPTPFVTLTVNSSGERGLIGLVFDPDFATNQYVYMYYTFRARRRITASAGSQPMATSLRLAVRSSCWNWIP
jgi:glucose/arabinose dehydrogenase